MANARASNRTPESSSTLPLTRRRRSSRRDIATASPPVSGGEVIPTSPMAMLRPVLARFDANKAPNKELLLSTSPGSPIIGKDGIEFGGTLWWNDRLRKWTTLPPNSKGKRSKLELRYDAAALSRETLRDVTLVVLDETDVVRERIVCKLRSVVQATTDRDRDRRSSKVYEDDLAHRCKKAEARAALFAGGSAVAEAQADIGRARSRQGRPGEFGVAAKREARRKKATAAKDSKKTTTRSPRPSPPKKSGSPPPPPQGAANSGPRAVDPFRAYAEAARKKAAEKKAT